MLTRRRLLPVIAAVAALALAACGKGGSGDSAAVAGEDMSQGRADAPVTLIEYASPTCPHCADWNRDVYPAFKARYVDTGKVRYVLREAMIHGPPDAAVFLLARCAGPDRYFPVIDEAMRTFAEAQASGDVRAWIMKLAPTAGLNEQQVNACIENPAKIEELNTRFDRQMKEHNVEATPTFILNGRKLDVNAPPTMADLTAMIDPLLAGK